MRLGLFGGTFDPVHFGHLVLAERCREDCSLDAVWFLPAGSPPHKQSRPISEAEDRASMLELAVAGHPQFSVNRMELEREGRSFTFQTLEQLHEDDPSRELYFLIGADSLADLPTWRNPRRILELAVVVAVNRGDNPLPDVNTIAHQIGNRSEADELEDRIRVVSIPGIDLSSTEIRRRVAERKSIRYLTPRAVEMYISEHGLYEE